MKLAAGYIVFDGLETLEASIRSIRNNVDLVIVSYQIVSWGGTNASAELIPTLERLQKIGLIDKLIKFSNFQPSGLVSPSAVLQAKQFELFKRQGCLDIAKELQCTHYLSMDADEFYRDADFKRAKLKIVNESLDATAVQYINYITPTLHRGYSRWKVPFIYRITPDTRHHVMQTQFSGIDPTRGLIDDSYRKSWIFDKDTISMHHMEMVRKDLLGKYLASSRFFPSRALLPRLTEDVERSKETKVLQFTKTHLGDSDNPLAAQILFECANEFDI
jgi:hypothetical protein